MSTPDDRDLSAAFEELTAPPSTANYASRTTGLDGRARASRWPQAVAGALAVAVALGAAGTFLALRSARHGVAPSNSPAGPPARSNAAMAYDSAAGVTVMFGGTDASGRTLTDAWTWDGSTWKAAARGPGPLVDIRMVDDPADAGVLLLGVPAAPVSGGGSVGSSGCVGSGTATPGSASGGTPLPANGTVRPSIGPVPTDAPPSTGAPAPQPTVSCPPTPVPVVPAAQTWLFSDGAWSGASGYADTTPPAGAQLAVDTTTHQVVAVSAGFSRCGPPMLSPTTNGDAIACPVAGASSKDAAPAQDLCPMASSCPSGAAIASWTWSNGSWQRATSSVNVRGITFLFTDPGTQHATLMSQWIGYQCASTMPCPAIAVAPSVTTWTWTGSTWQQKSQLTNVQAPPNVTGAPSAAVRGQIVVLTSTGETWNWSAGRWYDDAMPQSVMHPNARIGAAMAEGPGGTVVLFGGQVPYGFRGVSSTATVGADTWVWDAKSWRHVGGDALPVAPSPVPCSTQKGGAIPPCVEPQPAQVSPATPAATPQPSPA
ncbi:MAG: hypothetical protein M3019_02860 [Candidatus Dormibacteraeota bacterium]|nr:hypothetical protein [Candidatus Dormibacteraeota bacterium]